MDIIIYAVIFVIGTLFGSFFTLAVYRIPLGLDIVYKHSFCPNCNAKLKFKDLIPILSYISLGGKCRYCGNKIRIRYMLLEILSGIVFLAFVLSLKIDVLNINLNDAIIITFFLLYIATLFIIAGIDKEKINIQKSVLLFGLILAVFFMIYVCISKNQVIYTYIIYLAFIAIMLILDMVLAKKNLRQNYCVSILLLSLCMIIFTSSEIYYYTVAITLFLIAISEFIKRIRSKEKRKSVIENKTNNNLKIPIGFYLVVSNIFMLIISNFLK